MGYIIAAKEYALKYQQEKERADKAEELLIRAADSLRNNAETDIAVPIEIDEFLKN